MKKYLLAFNLPAGHIKLEGYEEEAVKAGAITLKQIAGDNYDIIMTSYNKYDCMMLIDDKYLADNGWVFNDVSDWTYEQYSYGKNWEQFYN